MARFFPFIGFVAIILPGILQAQKVDYNSIVLPADAKGLEFSEKLVRLAWQNNPANSIYTNQINLTDLETKLARRNWLNQIGITGNLNEFTINPSKIGDVPVFYPRYNIHANITLGNFANDPLQVKVKKEEKEIAVKNMNTQKLAVRAEVLRRYQTYLTNQELLSVQTEALETALASFSLAEQKFKSGDISIDNYNSAADNLNQQKTKKIMTESNLALAKIDLEEMIGVKLEDVL